MKDKIKQWFLKALHQVTEYLIHFIAVAAIAAVVAYLKYLRDNTKPLDYYFESAREYLSPLTIALLVVLLASTLFYASRLRRVNQLMTTKLDGFGVRTFSPHDTDKSRAEDWKLLCTNLEAANSHLSPIWIVGATGKNTFADPHSPLHTTILGYRGPINILLVRPQSEGFHYRIQQLDGAVEQDYTNEILDAIEFCARLYKKNKKVEVRLYDGIPIWKLIGTPQHLWLQHYSDKKHVDETPMFSFSRVDGLVSLHDGFQVVIKKRWDHDGSRPIDLGKFSRETWRECCGCTH